mmetsp:Transcript_30994/g.64681  ORF Transcript_30994/g.64681 Transcript_30994/m.64681 type:complete len:235 (-) Transcript_30994:219-923(-)
MDTTTGSKYFITATYPVVPTILQTMARYSSSGSRSNVQFIQPNRPIDGSNEKEASSPLNISRYAKMYKDTKTYKRNMKTKTSNLARSCLAIMRYDAIPKLERSANKLPKDSLPCPVPSTSDSGAVTTTSSGGLPSAVPSSRRKMVVSFAKESSSSSVPAAKAQIVAPKIPMIAPVPSRNMTGNPSKALEEIRMRGVKFDRMTQLTMGAMVSAVTNMTVMEAYNNAQAGKCTVHS